MRLAAVAPVAAALAATASLLAIFLLAPATARADAPDAAPRTQTIEFDGEDSLGGDEVTARDDAEFEPIPLRDRYQVDPHAPDTSPPVRGAEPPRRGCAGCAAAGTKPDAGGGLVVVVGLLIVAVRRRAPRA